LALLIDIIKQFVLLCVPKHPAEHSIERGIFKLLNSELVSRPIGSPEFFGYRKSVIDGGSLS
jgi:hypothetical protein